MKTSLLLKRILSFAGVISLSHAQVASEVSPELRNGLSEASSPDASLVDTTAATISGAGQTGTQGFQIIASEIGYSFSASSPDFDYGAEITPPLVDLDGGLLTPEAARTYWRAEPARPGEKIQIGGDIAATPVAENFNERYYYSPHAEKIFAIQTGSVQVNWVNATPDSSGDFRTLTSSYTIGFGTPLETRNIYWTEVDQDAPRVGIPTGIVQDLNILYNDNVPEQVTVTDTLDERIIPSNIDPQLVPKTTVWYDRSLEFIRAYNREGRVVVEYLGDPRDNPADELREHLGLEIIEVRKELTPVTVDSIIGEQILPSSVPGEVLEDQGYTPVLVTNDGDRVTQHFQENRAVYYGVKENLQAPNVELYWLEEGFLSISWPAFRNNYRIEWPEKPGDFEGIFARPNPGEGEAPFGSSFLDLLATNTPELLFQDDPTAGEASLDFQFKFSVDLDDSLNPVNRSLIRFNSGNSFWYIRLYSATTDHLESLTEHGTNYAENDPLDFHIERPAIVGRRLEPPHPSLALGAYIDPSGSDLYDPESYVDPFLGGGIEAANGGAIIPVNTLPENDVLRAWWFRKLEPRVSQADLFTPIYIPTVIGDYTIGYPTDAPEIIMASNAGTGDLRAEQVNGKIYFQNVKGQPGYNPNEEHALALAGRAYALRDDLNIPGVSSEPFVLLSHLDVDGRPDMSVFKVLREKLMADDPLLERDIVFNYPALAGTILEAPLPLPIISQPLEEKTIGGQKVRVTKNREVTPDGIDNVLNGPSSGNLTHYDRFTFEDRKGVTWVYRGPHADQTPKLSFQYYYPVQDGFAFPERAALPVGTIIPYLSELDDSGNPTNVLSEPLTVTYDPKWPEVTPVLHFGETLAKPKFGLPQILGNRSLEILYQQSIATDFAARQNSIVLHDSTINRVSNLSDTALTKIPESVATSMSRGKTYFQNLPSHLEDRIYFDPLVGTTGALIFEGRFVDELAGEDYVQLNTLSPEEVLLLKGLWKAGEPSEQTEWELLIDQLRVTPEYRWRDENFVERTRGYEAWKTAEFEEILEKDPEASIGSPEIIGQTIQATYGPTELPEIADSDQAVNDYLLTAIGGGSGYVTLVAGNGRLNSPEGEPVVLHVFRVGEELYRGELKPIVAANPLSENVTVRHTGDFAARPNDYEFEWKKAPPVNGLAPAAFTFGEASAGSFTYPFNRETSTGFSDDTGILDFTAQLTAGKSLNRAFIGLNLPNEQGVIVKMNGLEMIRYRAPEGEDSELAAGIPDSLIPDLTAAGDVAIFEISSRFFQAGANDLEIELFTSTTTPGETNFSLSVGIETKIDTSNNYTPATTPSFVAGLRSFLSGGAGIDTLGDNYFIMRYRPTNTNHPKVNEWSEWTNPALVEGWIKRVLAGINPFNQRISDFFENAVDTNTSLLASAGARWEGDIALNLDAVQDAGLIEIYETVLNRGIDLSIKSGEVGVDYAPANDALLLAAGYLNDLYTALGNEAFADAANPTVSFDGQALGTLGDAAVTAGFEENFRSTATSRFSFQGQVPTLLDEELALLRGRDDSLSPSIQTPPVYNRMFWNYTRGIDAGELIYALNYNIRELNDEVADGKIDAEDAARMFPQAHGDAYGHYLTAVKNYYRLLTDPDFTWGTRIEAVNVLGQPVSIDYFDERKFAAGAAVLTRTADQIISLERRKAFQSGNEGWSNLSDSRGDRSRFWGVDDWAARSGQGAYFHWIVGNAILPESDEVNEGIQKIDRTTVPELDAIAKAAEKIQGQLEAADARVNPLDLSKNSLLFDISPDDLAAGETYFEQILARAEGALKNAHAVFERAGDSTRLLRSLENQSQNLTQVVDDEEGAFVSHLKAIFGTPYPGDIGPGKIYPQGYEGPDLIRYMAIDRPFGVFSKDDLFAYDGGSQTFTLNLEDQGVIDGLSRKSLTSLEDLVSTVSVTQTVNFTLSENEGPYLIADPDLGKRARLGTIQTTLNEIRLAEEELYVALSDMANDRDSLFDDLRALEIEIRERNGLVFANQAFSNAKFLYEEILVAIGAIKESLELTTKSKFEIAERAADALPKVVGLSTDTSAPARAAIFTADISSTIPLTAAEVAAQQAKSVADFVFILAEKALELTEFGLEQKAYLRDQIDDVKSRYSATLDRTLEVDAKFVRFTRALEKYRTEFAKGQSTLADRETFRRRAAAAIQGYRTRDVAFRTFRSEALEEYQTLLDWASKYSFLAAQAYDYETGLLGSIEGQQFLGDIISSRALGVVGANGEPMLSASENGDPGLSGLLAKLKGDYEVVKGRLGFNNPETNGTTFSLRREFFRIPDGPEGDIAWQQKLESLVTPNLLIDADIATHAMQLNTGDSQPGFLINFPTTIEAGKNFFGKNLLAGDSDFTTTSFATKVHSLGVVFEGYQGMAPCVICENGPGDPTHNHDDALGATPNVFIIPSGLDTMRTPPLGGTQEIRTWAVQDYAMPLPFDLGSSEPTSTAIQDGTQTLQEVFRSPRRHPSFRATNRVDFFFTDQAADYTSSRLVGRSVWNSSWKLAIPAKELLADEDEGVARFIRTVKDIKLHLKTYSYSGN